MSSLQSGDWLRKTSEFYVIASDNMRPVEAVGPLQDRHAAMAVVTFLQHTKFRYPLSIATRRPARIPIMPAEEFVVKLEAAIRPTLLKDPDRRTT
jgi:hypothetical protein